MTSPKNKKRFELPGLGELSLHKKTSRYQQIYMPVFGSQIMITPNDEKRLPSRKRSHNPTMGKGNVIFKLDFSGHMLVSRRVFILPRFQFKKKGFSINLAQ